MLYLCGRSGNSIEGLTITIEKLGQIELAIDFCMDHSDDSELWIHLVDLAVKNPKYVSQLLASKSIANFINPLTLIEKVSFYLKIILFLRFQTIWIYQI